MLVLKVESKQPEDLKLHLDKLLTWLSNIKIVDSEYGNVFNY